MPYAVDNQFFQKKSMEAASGRAELMAELGLDLALGRKVILFASKLQYRKHCDHLLEAYRRLVGTAGDRPTPYLVIVGDGEARAELEAAAAGVGGGRRARGGVEAAAGGMDGVRFCGFKNQSELPRFFDLASVFVLPSRHEPWGLIVNEVMNAGRAVIVSDEVGCQPDLVTDGVEGCVFPAGDVAALTDALRRVLATPDTAVVMGERALAKIETWNFEEDVRGLRRAIAQVTRKISAE